LQALRSKDKKAIRPRLYTPVLTVLCSVHKLNSGKYTISCRSQVSSNSLIPNTTQTLFCYIRDRSTEWCSQARLRDVNQTRWAELRRRLIGRRLAASDK